MMLHSKSKKIDIAVSKKTPTGLCFRCEYRAQFYERGRAPRSECGNTGRANFVCYMYQPVKPMMLKYPDYGGEYGQLNKKRSPVGGGLFSARMECVGVDEGFEHRTKEKDGVYTQYWAPNDKAKNKRQL